MICQLSGLRILTDEHLMRGEHFLSDPVMFPSFLPSFLLLFGNKDTQWQTLPKTLTLNSERPVTLINTLILNDDDSNNFFTARRK